MKYVENLKAGVCVYQENTSLKWDIPRNTTSKRAMTSIG